MKKEVSKKSEYGKSITESQKNYRYGKTPFNVVTPTLVDDNIVIDLVKKQIMQYEKDN